jgi:hypothetical protein
MSVIITARKITIISAKTKELGTKTPLRAISIIPFEKVAPATMPKAVTPNIIHLEPALDPMAEFKKLAASLATPTIISQNATINNITTNIRYKSYVKAETAKELVI